MRASASVTSILLRKAAGLPAYIVIPGRVVAPWNLAGTTVVEGKANGHSFGRRNLKAWGKGSDDWFLEFTAPFCRTAGVDVGDVIKLTFDLADSALPPELAALIDSDESRARSWSKLSDRQRREAAEHVRAAKTEGGRQRRAAAVVVKLCGTLPTTMVTGKASAAKAAVGDEPVFAYIASLPQPQREIAERIDALAARTLTGLQRSVKWGMSYYGTGDGWCFSCGAFAGHVKLMFVHGAALRPVPPVTPVAMGKSTRGVELKSVSDIDARQIAAWMKQVTAIPGVGTRRAAK